MKESKVIRSSKVSTKFMNTSKKQNLEKVLVEYNRVVSLFIQELWFNFEHDKIPGFLPKEITDLVDSWLSARMIQSAGKQASGIVRGTLERQKKRIYIYEKLMSEGYYKRARKLKSKIESVNMTCPTLKDLIPMELDSRLVTYNLEKENSFDGWITLSSIASDSKDFPRGFKIQIPFKRTKHFNQKLKESVRMINGVRISNDDITFMFEMEKKVNKGTKTLGVDIGISDIFSTSEGLQPGKLNGKSLSDIMKKISRKKKGSKAFQRAVTERAHYINWSVKQINLKEIKELRRENIYNLRKFQSQNRYMQSFVYSEILAKLDRHCENHDVRVIKVSPTYTSQRCSVCGWTRKANRNGKSFKCDKCGNHMDADLNAAINISLQLKPIWYSARSKVDNKAGFYWKLESQELIVPDVQKMNSA